MAIPFNALKKRERTRQEREAEEFRTRVLASPDPRALDVLQAPENPANSACYHSFLAWQKQGDDAKQVAPDLPGFPASFFAARGHPHTLGSPAVMRANAFLAVHPHGAYKNVWLVGGAHMTNYCYAGTRILKEWTATEARPDMMEVKQPSCESQVIHRTPNSYE